MYFIYNFILFPIQIQEMSVEMHDLCGNFHCANSTDGHFLCVMCVALSTDEKNILHQRQNDSNCLRRHERINGFCSGTTTNDEKFCSFCVSIKIQNQEQERIRIELEQQPLLEVRCKRCDTTCFVSRTILMHISDITEYMKNYECNNH